MRVKPSLTHDPPNIKMSVPSRVVLPLSYERPFQDKYYPELSCVPGKATRDQVQGPSTGSR